MAWDFCIDPEDQQQRDRARVATRCEAARATFAELVEAVTADD